MKLEIKSVVIGIIGSGLLMFAFGYKDITGSDSLFAPSAITWGMVVPSEGKVLARDNYGKAFIIDVSSSMATRVEFDTRKINVVYEQITLGGKD